MSRNFDQYFLDCIAKLTKGVAKGGARTCKKLKARVA